MSPKSVAQKRYMEMAGSEPAAAKAAGVAQDAARDAATDKAAKIAAPRDSRKTRYANPRKKMDVANALTGAVLPGGQ